MKSSLMLPMLLAVATFGSAQTPAIQKLGTLDCDMVEATPIVFQGKLYRFEYVREDYKPNKTGKSYFRFMDVEARRPTAGFAEGYHLGSAFTDGDAMYAYGVERWGQSRIHVFRSTDLEHWTEQLALEVSGWKIFNNSVCKGTIDGREQYVMAFEVGEPAEVVGNAFTNFFAFSDDLLNWKLGPLECVYAKERYTACPSIRYLAPYFYMTYLEAYPGPEYNTCLVRSRDLKTWESSPKNPILKFNAEEDKKIANPKLNEAQRKRIAEAFDRNNSDFDFCEFKREVIISYSWGNQLGNEFLAEARFRGTQEQFLQMYFPK